MDYLRRMPELTDCRCGMRQWRVDDWSVEVYDNRIAKRIAAIPVVLRQFLEHIRLPD
jgi:hypothetical protein